MLLDDLRLEAAMAITRDLDGLLTELAFKLLATETVAGIANGVDDRLMPVMAEVMGHLGIEDAFDELLSQLLANYHQRR